MVVQQHVLNWLYSVLTSEYQDVNRTYNDVAQALSQYPSLSPRTDVHTFDNGVSALLLHLSGTIPVVFRGTTYRFPISLWIPHAYPRDAPLGYVTPTENMMVRPGQHVDPQGRIYHPYLVGWAEFWDKSSLLDFLAILRDIFAKEPPVVSRQQARAPLPQHASPTPTPPPVPPLPPDMSRHAPQQAPAFGLQDSRPPLPPPKGSDLPQVVSGPTTHPDAPPLPPLPDELRRRSSQYGAQAAATTTTPPPPPPPPQSNRFSRYDSAPPLPPLQGRPQTTQPYQHPPPNIPYQPQPHNQHAYQQGGPPPPEFAPQDSRRASMILPPAAPYTTTVSPPGPGPSPYAEPPPNWQPAPHQPLAQPQPKPPPPPDLMDEPFSLALPSSSASHLAPPPIPPNPEKDMLLRQLASTLHDLRQRARAQNESSLAGLAAQRAAMLAAMQRLQADTAALAPLSSLLASNTAILQRSLREADHVAERARARASAPPGSGPGPDGGPPDVDELLVAPTVVANQLYDVAAEERALADAIFVLGRAVERGRVGPAVFARTTRALAREWFLKKALARKIGRGMGLAGC
ncbi:UEV-domain-containing protein [Durotheca rogersii]|uniref:UEV-domain-containing protein n=1 Tax=Durotheca rogersii TaxID=419775 RepID=UPI00221F7752|nr:UEV-domain-containing protein [Durotheca rogersii]KAI5860839.1 UEV-domain-containing protein [Durotheca rogersii]